MRDDKRDPFVEEFVGRGRGGSRTAPTNDQRDQFLDELVEASLKQFRGEEPRPGLEMRIIAGIRSRERAARRRGLAWTVAACAGMLAAVILALHFARAPSRQPVPSASVPRPTAKPLASSGAADARSWNPRLVQGQKPRTPRAGGQAARPPRPEQFPTPFPLTEQEKLLLAYFNKVNKSDLVVDASETNGAPVTELKISGIEIAPLEIKPLDDAQSETEK